MSTLIFGPYCTQILGDLGAEVTKIEPSGGDPSRGIGTSSATQAMGPMHLRLNRGKRSVAWDLQTDAGRESLRRLIARSDVFIHNARQDAIERAGLDYESVRSLRPDIVYVHCVGFDSRGPEAGRPAYDDTIQAASGLASLLTRVDGDLRPRFIPATLADKVSGLHAVYAVLAALIHRLRTGEGQCVEVPMLESMVSFNLVEHLYEKTFLPPLGSTGYPRQLDRWRQPMPTKDGHIVVAPYQPEKWRKFFSIAESEPLSSDTMTHLLEPANSEELHARMAALLRQRTSDEWLQLLRKNEIPASAVSTIDDLLDSPQLRASGLLVNRVHPTEGEYVEVGSPIRFSRCPEPGRVRHAAAIGQHSQEVSRELGLRMDANHPDDSA